MDRWVVICMDAVMWESLVGCLVDFVLIMSDVLSADIFCLGIVIASLPVMFCHLTDMFQELFRLYG